MPDVQLVDRSQIDTWLSNAGGGFHSQVAVREVPFGRCIVARDDLPADTTVVSCPLALAVTRSVAQRAISNLIDTTEIIDKGIWSERQWICSYLCFHWIIGDARTFIHRPYLDSLPPANLLRTSLYFTKEELEYFKGTNLYGATLDRERHWIAEWSQCQSFVTATNSDWGSKFTWSGTLFNSSYLLSSRAFPSSLLSSEPSCNRPLHRAVLLPGVDSLNHARGQPVTWLVEFPKGNEAVKEPRISLVLHSATKSGQELFNNYGPKPNSELILGYGFSLNQNPDDTIILKIGGIDGKKWEVGRSARGVDDLWETILESLGDPGSDPDCEDQFDAAQVLMDMVQGLLDQVALMLHNYVEGQRDILESVIEFARNKERVALEEARVQGIEIVLEDD
ncbi:SET domain protein [Infundibulicybe gibba]|nr:SET domain protein [Infundibulicybe gibba]